MATKPKTSKFMQPMKPSKELAAVVGDRWTRHIVVTTDPDKGPLRELVRSLGLRSLAVPPR